MNMTLDEYKARAKADLDNAFEKGKSQGGGGDAQILLDRMRILDGQWQSAAFPEGYNFVFDFKTKPNTLNMLLMQTTGIKTAKLICKVSGSILFSGLIRASTTETLDITDFKPTPTNINYFALSNSKIVSVLGEMDMSNCTTATNAFNGASALEQIRYKEGTISIALDFKSCTKLSAESYDSIMQGLSSTATGQTLTLTKYATVKATYDAKYGEGSWDILAASKTNWTIAYS
jgi:hypothetical protein